MSGSFVELQNVHYTYPDGTPAVRGVSFAVDEGQTVGIVGGNGAGKSTLLQHLNGYLLPGSGTVRIGDTTLSSQTLAAIRRMVGMVFQDPDDQLFMPTVFDDVAFGPLNMGLPPDDVRRRVEQSLARVGMSHVAQRPPYRLSGGEKRAVAIATVLAMDPQVLVMDEPSANLDPRGRRRLIELLKSFPHTRIIATHDLEMVVHLCSSVVVLDAGQVVAQGPTAQILSDESLMLRHGLERPHILQHHHPHPPASP